MIPKSFTVSDLYSGAGGTSTAAIEAITLLGYKADLTAINHWPVAIATHTANHPGSRHLCTGLDAVNPRDLYKEGELDLLWASPECTHHSVARGGKPINDQSRATAWCVVRWAEALRPPVILVENVPEFETWGAIGSNGRPLKTKRGATFLAWVGALESLGYRVDWRVLCAADYGDPTTRRRLFIQAVRGKRKIVWPDPTHAPKEDTDLYGTRKAWVAAREIIDWSLQGQSIYERKRPLSPKTMRRIMAGLEKFGLKPFIVPQQSGPLPRDVDDPLPTVCAHGSQSKLAEPFLVAQFGERKGQAPRIHSIDQPCPTVTAQKGGPALAQPFLEPFTMSAGGPECGPRPVSEPLGTVLTRDHRALVDPFLVKLRGTSDQQIAGSAHSVEDPVPTISAGGGHVGVVQPYLIPQNGSNGPRSIDAPAPTVTTTSRGVGLAQPFLVKASGLEDRRPRELSDPLPTVTGSNDYGLVQPFLIHTAHGKERNALDVETPLPTVTGNRGDVALVEPALLPQGGGGAVRPVTEPVPTVATDGAIGLVEPYLVKYYGCDRGSTASVDKPLAAITTADRFGLVRPIIVLNGEKYLLDIRFRMLQPRELAGAQGFLPDYKFTGTKTDQVKQIGNAVPRRLARAIVLAVLSQRSDIHRLLKEAA